jgi:hypothetical protein
MLQGHCGPILAVEKKFISFLLLRPDGGRFVTNFPHIFVVDISGRAVPHLTPAPEIFEVVGKFSRREF